MPGDDTAVVARGAMQLENVRAKARIKKSPKQKAPDVIRGFRRFWF
jgi:hypothetical protein